LLLASLNRRSENVIVKAIVIPKLELCNVQWQVFGANFVERADTPTLEDTPETLNRLGVNRSDDVLTLRMVNGGVRASVLEVSVPSPLVDAEQA
jgi:hypothetical protein